MEDEYIFEQLEKHIESQVQECAKWKARYEGKIFSDDGGKSWYQSKDSRVYIKFPYRPHTEKIILETKEE